MLKTLRWVIPFVLCSAIALAGGGKRANWDKMKPERVAPEMSVSPAAVAAITGRQVNNIGPRSTSAVGTYTTLGGLWDYQTNGGSTRFIEVDSLTGIIHVITMTGATTDSGSQDAARRTTRARSTDDGVTWQNFADVNMPFGLEVPNLIRSGYPQLNLQRGPFEGEWAVANHYDPGIGLQTGVFIQTGTPGGVGAAGGLPILTPPVAGGEPIWPWVASTSTGKLVVASSVNNTVAGTHRMFINKSSVDATTWDDPWTVQFPLVDASARAAISSTASGKVGVMATASGDTVLLLESTNNGDTWPNSTIVYPPYRIDAEGDTIGCWVFWDFIYDGGENPLCVFNTSTFSPEAQTFDVGDSRVEFWSAATGYVDAVPKDTLQWVNGSGQANHLAVGNPSLARSGSKLVITFTGLSANAANVDPYNGLTFADVYIVQSTDGGFTWSLPLNITKTPQMDERYSSISRYNPAGYAYITWQEDSSAGRAIPAGFEGRLNPMKRIFYKANLSTLFPADDIQALSVNDPSAGLPVKEGTAFSPKGSFRNVGLAGQTSVTVRMQVLNSVPSVVYTNDKTIATIASGATAQVTFDPVPGSLTVGTYTTRAIALLGGDLDNTNDTTSSSFQIIPTVTVAAGGYSTDFEAPEPEGSSFGWHTAEVDGAPSDWQLGTPNKGVGAQISHAHSGTKCWVTKLSGTYSNNRLEYLGSPVLDLTAIPGNISVEFWHNFRWEHDWDGGVLQYSTDGGTTWDVADHVLGTGPNYNTTNSTGWYISNVDSGGPNNGQYAPPYWTDSTTIFPSNTDGWIRSSTVIPVGGLSDVRLRWMMEADAASVREGWAIDDISISAASVTVGVPLTTGWNMVSNPVHAADEAVQTLYPTSAFAYGFRFDPATGYQQSTTMSNGPGYWVKSTSSGTTNVTGGTLISYEVPVVAGWNMVGSVSDDVDTSTITSTPGGLKASDWFGFTGSYTASAQIEPGKAYWVKSYGTGKFFFENVTAPASRPQGRGVSLADNFSTITIRDAKGGTQTLYFGVSEDKDLAVAYELPPVPPTGAFDARFDGSLMLKTYAQTDEVVALPISIQAVAYPLEVSWNIKNGSRDYVIADGFGGLAVAPKIMGNTGSLKITNSAVNRLVIRTANNSEIPTEYALLRNYPNPFNPSTNIKFGLPLQSKVTVEIYNVLGQRVRTLLNDEFVAGYHVVEWNGKNDAGQQLSSGVYMLKIAATNTQGRSFSDVQKLMMLK